jgi:hypothetical protein
MGAVPTTDVPAEYENLRTWLLAQAEEHGNAVVQVAEDGDLAPYAFTVGAWRRFGVAEAVVVGMPAEMSEVLLRAYVSRSREGVRFRPGTLYDGFFQGVDVAFEQVAKGWYPEFLGSAFLLYAKGDFPALQIIVPTPDGYWPWEADAPSGFARWQQILTESGLPESWTPGVDGP